MRKFIDHTLLKPFATEDDIKKLCNEAIENSFFSVCVNPTYVKLASDLLNSSEVKVCAVVGFPLGATTKIVKLYEAQECIRLGAHEIDMVINIGKLKDGKYSEVENEIKEIKAAIGSKTLKVIIETCFLTNEEKVRACQAAVSAGADFVKTSTGFGTDGANFEDVRLMIATVDGRAKVKASGGIKDYETAEKYVDMGVQRLGTSSGIKILTGKIVEENEY